MVAIIQESPTLAALIPEVHYYIEADTPLDFDLGTSVGRYLAQLVRMAFYRVLVDDVHVHDPDWITRLRADPALIALAVLNWKEVHVLDVEGTFIILTQEQLPWR
jgi:hypothetical protein